MDPDLANLVKEKIKSKFFIGIVVIIFIFYYCLNWIKSKLYFHPQGTDCRIDKIIQSGGFYSRNYNIIGQLEDIIINKEDPIKSYCDEWLHGWFYKSRSDTKNNDKKLVLFFHGNAGALVNHLRTIQDIKDNLCLDSGYDLGALDYSGYGYSKFNGRISESIFKKDAELFFNYFLDLGYQEKNIILFGQSIGSPVASYLASKHPNIKSLILLSPPASISDVVESILPYGLGVIARFLCKGDFMTKDYVRKYLYSETSGSNIEAKKRLILLHGKYDMLVRYNNSKIIWEYQELGDNNESLIEIEGGHNTIVIKKEVWDEIKRRLE